MFTIKFYSDNGYRQKIIEAESFTILRGGSSPGGDEAEITVHQKNQTDDRRYDIKPAPTQEGYEGPPVFQRAIIENMAGKTTEIIQLHPRS